MFQKNKQPPIKSLLAQGLDIKGDITFSEGLRLDGLIQGNIRASHDFPSMLVISETAHVMGGLYADHIIINGRVDGPVHARVMLELQPKASVHGDVQYSNLEMHQGAIVAGQLRPDLQEEKPTLKIAVNND